jgi:hypothetical protein
VRCLTVPEYSYILESSTNLRQWTPQTPPMAGTGGWLSWPVDNQAEAQSFFRIQTTRP